LAGITRRRFLRQFQELSFPVGVRGAEQLRLRRLAGNRFKPYTKRLDVRRRFEQAARYPGLMQGKRQCAPANSRANDDDTHISATRHLRLQRQSFLAK